MTYKRREFEKRIRESANDFAYHQSVLELLEFIFPNQEIGDIILDAYNADLIPEDIIERLIGE